MKLRQAVFTLLLTLLPLAAIGAEVGDWLFRRPVAVQGLSSQSVTDICQDEKGRIWVGTLDGLNCYDGTTFRVYGASGISNSSLGFMEVRRLVPDGYGHLYVLTTKDLYLVDLADESAELLQADNPAAVCKSPSGIIVADNSGIREYLTKEKRWVRRHPKLKLADAGRYMATDSKGQIWLTQSHGGLLLIDKHGNCRRLYSGMTVTGLYIDRHDRLWTGVMGKGVVCLTTEGDVAGHYNISSGDNRVRAFCEDGKGNIWVGMRNGIEVITPQGEVSHIEADPYRPGKLVNNSVTALFCDSQGTVWVGTYWGGICYVMAQGRNFVYYTSDKYPGLSFGPIGAMCFDGSGNLWICGEGSGLNVLEAERQTFLHFNAENGTAFSSNFMKDVCYDKSKECLWIASDYSTGINCFDLHSRRNTIVPLLTSTPLGDALFEVECSRRYLYIGASNSVVRYDKQSGRSQIIYWCRSLFTHNYNSLLLDSHGRLWFAVNNGIMSYDTRNGSMNRYKVQTPFALSSYKEIVNVIFEASDGSLLLGTHGLGLYKLGRGGASFEPYIGTARLNCNNIRSIAESRHGLLIGTDNGIRVMADSASIFQIPQLPISIVSRKSLLSDADGNIYAGGSLGLVKVSSAMASSLNAYTHLMFTSLYIDDKEITPGDGSGVLLQTLPYASRISIGPGKHVIALRFSAGGSGNLDGGDVEYMLEGYNTRWTDVRGGNDIVFTNLPAGRYIMRLRLKQNPKSEASVALSVAPHWWATWWAKLLWLLLAVAAIILFVREYKARFYLKTSLEFERKDKQRIAELDQERMRFFTDVSHDIRTPVTLILGQLEMVAKAPSLSPYLRAKLSGIRHSATSLKRLVDELLDFKKMESGSLKLKVAQADLATLISKHLAMFRPTAKERAIDLSFDPGQRAYPLWCDAHQLGKVFNNLLSNSFKNTADGGKISISVDESDTEYVVKVADTGSGMPPEVAAHVFERFYQGEDARGKGGTGIGLAVAYDVMQLHHGAISVESQMGVGTCFTLRLPKGNAHFTADELKSQPQPAPKPEETVAAEPPQPAEAATEPAKKQPQKQATVLVVDDNKDIRSLVAEALSPFYQIVTATDGRDAIDKIGQGLMPDLVVSDIVMPRMSGSELCAKIKTNPKLRHIPVVMLTAIDTPTQEVAELKNGADLYVVKPFEVDKLVLQCRNLINMKNAWQQSSADAAKVQAETAATNAADKKFVDSATAVVRSGIKDEAFSVDVMARQMGMSRTALFSRMKAVTGKTPHAFISDIRLSEAAEMLRQRGDLTISDISWSLNFSSPDYFSRCFKKVFGMTPQQYRNGGAES